MAAQWRTRCYGPVGGWDQGAAHSGHNGEATMKKEASKLEIQMSRRTLLQNAALAGAAAVPVILAGARSAGAKMSPSAVAYQDSPKGSQKCSNCKLFEPPSACRSVSGVISPNGWCKIWVKA